MRRRIKKLFLISFEKGDVVIVRTFVHSNKDKGVVAKLVHQTRGPYIIVDKSSEATYHCMKYGKLNGVLEKFRTEDLYLLPPVILPSEPDDTQICVI